MRFPARPAWVWILVLTVMSDSLAEAADWQRSARAPEVRTYRDPVPENPKFWAFTERYLKHSVVDLIVSGTDPSHLSSALKELLEIKRRGVLTGSVVVVGGRNMSQLDANLRKKTRNPYARLSRELHKYGLTISRQDFLGVQRALGIDQELHDFAEKLELGRAENFSGLESIKRSLNIQYSPTWIVTHRGKTYIYEGARSLTGKFSRNGEFTDVD